MPHRFGIMDPGPVSLQYWRDIYSTVADGRPTTDHRPLVRVYYHLPIVSTTIPSFRLPPTRVTSSNEYHCCRIQSNPSRTFCVKASRLEGRMIGVQHSVGKRKVNNKPVLLFWVYIIHLKCPGKPFLYIHSTKRDAIYVRFFFCRLCGTTILYHLNSLYANQGGDYFETIYSNESEQPND